MRPDNLISPIGVLKMEVVSRLSTGWSEYGTPFSTLTDNGKVYTARFARGKNGFEYLLCELGVIQKNGSLGHPQMRGEIERFHHTLKKWITEQEPTKDLDELQQQLNKFHQLRSDR